jgi:DNA-binding beta-propeller fold protein YncE
VSTRVARLWLALSLVALGVAVAAPVASAANAFVLGGTGSNGEVVPVNIATNEAGKPVVVGETPNDIAISPDAETAYVAVGSSGGKIVLFDTETGKKKGEITGAGLVKPLNVVVSPDGGTLYVIKEKSVVPINLETLARGTTLTLPAVSAGGAAISPDGSALWVSVRHGMVRIDTALSVVGPTISLPNDENATDVEISADGKTVYVADYSFAGISRVNTATGTALTDLTTTYGVRAIELSDDGTKLYSAQSGGGFEGLLGTYDLVNSKALANATVGSLTAPSGLAISKAENAAYTANTQSKEVSVIDLTTGQTVITIPIPVSPTRIAIAATSDSGAEKPKVLPWETSVAGSVGDPTNPTLNVDVSQRDEFEEPVPPAELKLKFSSNNPAVLPVAGISATGEGATRTLSFAPIARGVAKVTVTATGVGGKSGSASFTYSASRATTPTTRFLESIADASTAIGLGDGYLLVAEGEGPRVGVYREGATDFPNRVRSVGSAPNPGTDGLDLESSARAGDVVYWLGSHGNEEDGTPTATRSAVIATRISGPEDQTELTRIGAYGGLRADLLAWDHEHGDRLGFAADAAAGVKPSAPNGFDIEGAEFAPDSTSTLYLGFSAPVEPSATGGKALIVPVTNIERVVTGADAKATFGEPILLDLGGMSIREIRRNASGQYLILAGYPQGTGNQEQALFSWTGYPEDAPVELSTAIPPSAEENAGTPGAWEGIGNVPDVLTPGSTVRLIMDEGFEKLYGDGVVNREDADPVRKKSRTDLFTLTGAVGAVAQTTTPTFPAQAIGSVGPGQWVTVTNTGSQKLVIGDTSVVGADDASAGDFLIGQDECHGRTLGLGATCRIQIRFAPARAGVTSTAHLAIDANVAGGEADVPLSATSTGLATGPEGDKGPTGDKGATGDQGSKGPTGDKGATGNTGAAGPKGESGEVTIRITFDSGSVSARNASARKIKVGTTLLSAPLQGGWMQGKLIAKWGGKNLELARGRVAVDSTGHVTLLLTKRKKAFEQLAGQGSVDATLTLTFRPIHKGAPVTAEKTVTVRLAG